MIHIDILPITLSDGLLATVLVTSDTLTLCVATDPVLHVELDHSETPEHTFYQVHCDGYATEPSNIRAALDAMLYDYYELENTTLTDDEFRALPVLYDINISCFDLFM